MILTAAVVLALCNPSIADVINGGFENGDFTGWEVSIPYGESEFYGLRPAGSAEIVFGDYHGNLPAGGDFMARIGSGDEYFLGTDTYEITASQTLALSAHDTISGEAFFFNGDYLPQDFGFVKILDNLGAEMAVLWMEYSGGSDPSDPNNADYLSATDWAYWEWQAPTDGLFEIVLGVSTFGDNAFSSYAYFDHITVASVPEPTLFSLTGLSFLGLLMLRSRFKGSVS